MHWGLIFLHRTCGQPLLTVVNGSALRAAADGYLSCLQIRRTPFTRRILETDMSRKTAQHVPEACGCLDMLAEPMDVRVRYDDVAH